MIEVIVLIVYGLCLLGLLTYSVVQLHLAIMHRLLRTRSRPRLAQLTGDDVPRVTVQLPIYNERYVAPRLIEHVARFDYPRDRFEIHVLDDSCDDTAAIVDALLPELRARGLSVEHIRRTCRSGYKAGALRDAMTLGTGEFIAIFDADFCPAPDFLRKALPYFNDANVAVVQMRWGYLNEAYSLLTRLQAFLLRLHFDLEQGARTGAGFFANFNGTGGVWRRTAIEDAGGWRADTLTEDIDLSYRAQLRGWRMIYLEHETCDSELPVDMEGFRSQQFRWMKGGAENARLHARSILRSRLHWTVKLHAWAHLFASTFYLLTLVFLSMSIALVFVKNTFIDFDYVQYSTPFFAVTISLLLVFHEAQWRFHARERFLVWFVVMMPAFMILTLGLALHNGTAALLGWLGRRSEFVRTPKYGIVGETGRWASTVYAHGIVGTMVLAELLMLAATGLALIEGWRRDDWSLYPLQVMAFIGLAWVIGLSVSHARHARGRA